MKIVFIAFGLFAMTACGSKKIKIYSENDCQKMVVNGSAQYVCNE